ncbi:hypothetical protein B0J14DRAFT_581367 [Halenospora varia]|nr:hypothetical protein B0J14DRAFT_581367 [Halenospora varia]
MFSASSSSITFPPLDPQHYEWRHCSNSLEWERPALAGETMWAHRPEEYHQLFLSATLTLLSPVTQSVLRSAAGNSWICLRYDTPDVGVTTRKTDDRKVYMRTRAIRHEAEAYEWCEETLVIETSKHETGFDALKEKVVSHKARRSPGPAFLWLVAIANGDDMVQRIELMLNIKHQITDGIGIKILLSKYLPIFSTHLSKPERSKGSRFDWEYSPKIPSTPWINLLNDDQVLSGPEYERTIAWNREVLLENMPQNPGLPLRQTSTPATQNHHFITLTQSQSTKILSAIKPSLGQAANITQLGHAAMVLALLRHTELTSENTTLHSPCWLNGRRYLQYPDLDLELLPPTNSYIPICQSFTPIIFSDLHELVLSSYALQDEIREKLIIACKAATEQYSILKTRKSVMPQSIAVMEYLGSRMSQTGTTTIATTSSQGNLQTRPLAADPFFLSDGIVENYIDHQYLEAFTVDDVQFAANAEGPNLIVRMCSWRGCLGVSGEWRGCDYEEGFVRAFLRDVVGIMGVIVNEH